MAAIQNLTEPWAGHSFKEIEDFVTSELNEIEDILEEYNRNLWRYQYLTFEAIENNTTVYIGNNVSSPDMITIYASTNNGHTWTSYVSDGSDIATLNAGEKVIVKGNNPTGFHYRDGSNDEYAGNFFYANKPVYVYGNVMSLLYEDNFREADTLFGDATFAYLFSDYSGSTALESNIITTPEKNLVLPATRLTEGCYSSMFANCENILYAPELPAITLSDHCYDSMFQNCSKLETVPSILGAPIVTDSCYYKMFQNCYALTASPELPALRVCDSSYKMMFSGCRNLNYIKCLATNISIDMDGTLNWVDDVAESGTFVKNTNMDSWPIGASGIPSGWTIINA